jgi:hypothetical protein
MRGDDTSCLGCDAVSLCEYILAFKKNCSAFIFSCVMLNASELWIFQCQYLLAQQYIITAQKTCTFRNATERTSNLTSRPVPTTYISLQE